MYSLVSYLEARVEALVDNRAELQLEIERLRTVVFELCSDDCTQEYKDLMKQQIFSDIDEL